MSTIAVTQTRVVHAEWTKLRSQRSAAWALLATLALVVGVGFLYCLLRVTRPPTGTSIATFDPTAVSLAGVQLAQLAIGALGVLLVSNEYATGMIRATFTAVPGRLQVLWGKATVMTLATFILCVPATITAFLLGQTVLARQHLNIGLNNPDVTRAVIGAGLYLGIIGLLGLSLGTLIRNTAGAISTLLAALYGLPLILGLLPTDFQNHIYKFLPAPAGLAITATAPDPDSLSPWTGLAVMATYTAITLTLAAYRIRRTDA